MSGGGEASAKSPGPHSNSPASTTRRDVSPMFPEPPGSLPTSPLFTRRTSASPTPTSPFDSRQPTSPSASPQSMGFPTGSFAHATVKPVPEGWCGYFDANLGITYYHKADTGETAWAVDMGWPEVAPDETTSASDDRSSPRSPASLQRRETLLENQSFSVMSAEPDDEDAIDGWAIAVDRKTGGFFRYCPATGSRRPYVA